jgi:hypothetical protein
MCGICGELTFGAGAAVDVDTLVSMRERLLHRGPDDKAVWLSTNRRAGLAFRRLAIIDLSAEANQPLPNEDGSVGRPSDLHLEGGHAGRKRAESLPELLADPPGEHLRRGIRNRQEHDVAGREHVSLVPVRRLNLRARLGHPGG